MIRVITYKVALLVLLAVAATFSGTSAYFNQQRTADLHRQNANLEGQVSTLNGQVSQLQSQLSQLQAKSLRTLAIQVVIMDETAVSSQYGVAIRKYVPVIFPFAFTPQGEFRNLTRVALSIYYLPGPTPSCANCDGLSTALNGAGTAMVPMKTFYQLNLSTMEDPSYVANLKTGINLLQLDLLTPSLDTDAVMYIAKIIITIEYQSLL